MRLRGRAENGVVTGLLDTSLMGKAGLGTRLVENGGCRALIDRRGHHRVGVAVTEQLVGKAVVIFLVRAVIVKVQGGFLKMSYFGVKHGHLRAFLSQKTLF